MKLTKAFIHGFSILGLTCLASAQEPPKGPPEGAPPPGGRPHGDAAGRLAEFIKRADSDGDGKISKEEFVNMGRKESDERFARMDANKDGFVDKEEVGKIAQMMRGGAGSPGQGARRPEGGPPGGDGGFRRPPGGDGGRPDGARPEGARPPGGEGGPRPEGGFRPGGEGGPRGGGMFGDPKETFKRMDADGNGSISEDEYIKATERMREMFRNRGGQPGSRRPEGEGGEGGFRRPPAERDAPKAPEGDKPKEGA